MLRKAFLLGLCACTTPSLAQDSSCQLPQPHYDRKASDPPWLPYVMQFHGHLGPSVVAGARLGMAGLRAVDAKGYFDVEITCEGPFAKPPQSCFLDGIQVATGATMGKRTLHWVEAERIVVRVRNTSTGMTAELQPTPKLLNLLGVLQPRANAQSDAQTKNRAEQKREEEQMKATARNIAMVADKEILTITLLK